MAEAQRRRGGEREKGALTAVMTKPVYRLEGEALSAITLDARVAAIRWDVIPWGLVLDLDAPVCEAPGAPMKRAWLLFPAVSEISWPFIEARLPNGCWLSSKMSCSWSGGGVREYRFTALLPRFSGEVMSLESPPSEVMIRAQRVSGAASLGTHPPGEHGILAWAERGRLARDEALISALDDA